MNKNLIIRIISALLIFSVILGNTISYADNYEIEKPSVMSSTFTATGEELLSEYEKLLKSETPITNVPEAVLKTTISKMPNSNTWQVQSGKDNCFGSLFFGDMDAPQDATDTPKSIMMFLKLGDGSEEAVQIIDTYLEVLLYLCSYSSNIEEARTLLDEMKSQAGEIVEENGTVYLLSINQERGDGFIIIAPKA